MFHRPRYGAVCRTLLLALPILLLAASAAQARDVFVVISGGGNPNMNNYSQYLQARAYVEYLHGRYSPKDIWVFFGAGNVTVRPPQLADVLQTVKDERGQKSNAWIPGVLPGNRPARLETIARAFHEEILPAVHDGGTLYLLVGDHGEPSGSDFAESAITLWGFDRDSAHPWGWRTYKETLGVAQLRQWLKEGLGRGRVVFTMSQCYSGGFHYLGVPRFARPNPAWFNRTPAWAKDLKDQTDLPLAAGMTSTDEVTIASGCTADVDADRWKGYERYLPENLLGWDLFTLKPAAPSRNSLYDAHVEAVLVDRTLDKPRTSSEHYLQGWARTFASMSTDSAVKDSFKPYLETFKQAMDGAAQQVSDAAFIERQRTFQRMIEQMVRQHPTLAGLPKATGAELKTAMESPNRPDEGKRSDGKQAETLGEPSMALTLWSKHIAPAWTQALKDNRLDLPAPVLTYEREMLQLEEQGSGAPLYSLRSEGWRSEYWYGGYGDLQNRDPVRSSAIAEWSKERVRKILDWAKKSEDSRVRMSASVYEQLVPAYGMVGSEPSHDTGGTEGKPDRATAAARIHFYRQVLAAWQVLLEVGEQPALARVKALTQLERTALPAPRR